jgi:thymidylate kinase
MKTVLVTLSGTHGTGKSTHAGRCYYLLNKDGFKFSYLRHQDLIDPFGFILRRSARVLGFRATNQLERMHPVRVLWSLYILFVYLPLLAGGIGLRRFFGYSVVADRYFYDFIVAFWGNRTHVPMEHLLIWVVPRPDISFVLDADEKRILQERPEHTAEFIRDEKRLYDKVANSFGLERIRTTESKQKVWKQIVTEVEASLGEPHHNNP